MKGSHKFILFIITSTILFPLSLDAKVKKSQADTTVSEEEDEYQTEPEKRFPTGCLQMGYQFRNYHVIFKPTAKFVPQTAYLVHNLSKDAITLYQERTGDEPYIIHINNTLPGGRWTTYATDEPSTKFICSANDPKSGQYNIVNCNKVLDICEYPSTRFGDNHHGNYWLTPSTTGNSAARALQRHGVLLFDPKRKLEG